MRARALAVLAMLGQSLAATQTLLFTRTTGYRHDSIPDAISAIRNMSSALGTNVTASEDPSLFSDSGLAPFDAIIMALNSEPDTVPVSATPPMLTSDQQAALARFFAQPRKGYVGIHSASACLFVDPTYVKTVGASFDKHADLQSATFTKTNASNGFAATASVPSDWRFEEEVYSFLGDPRSNGNTVVLSVEETSFSGYTGNSTLQGIPHPIAWYRPENALSVAPGRGFYTSLGHATATWSDSTFLSHVQQGIAYVLAASGSNATTATSSTVRPSSSASTGSSLPTVSQPSSANSLGSQQLRLLLACTLLALLT